MGLSGEYLISACLSAGQRTDMKVFPEVYGTGDWQDVKYVIADKGYDYYDVRKLIRDTGKRPVIPRREGAVCPGLHTEEDRERYKTRSAIERFFGKIKENKRLALRFDKLDVTFFSFFAIACLKVFKLLY